jgi:hypothetical protein
MGTAATGRRRAAPVLTRPRTPGPGDGGMMGAMGGAVTAASPRGQGGAARLPAGGGLASASRLSVQAVSGLGEISLILVSEGGLEHGNRGDFPGPGKSCNQGNKSGARAHGHSARCSLFAPAPGLCTVGMADVGDWLPGLPAAVVRRPPHDHGREQVAAVRCCGVVSGRWHVAACKSGRSGSLTRSVMPMSGLCHMDSCAPLSTNVNGVQLARCNAPRRCLHCSKVVSRLCLQLIPV